MAGPQNQTKIKGKRPSRKPKNASTNLPSTTEPIPELGEAQTQFYNPSGNIKLLKRFNLTPSMASQLRRNVLAYTAAFHANVKSSPEQLKAVNNSWPGKESAEQIEWEDSCIVNLVLGGFDRLSLSEKSMYQVDLKIELISSLVNQSREAKDEVTARKEWACKKVIQAAQKLSHDLIELKMLRMEKKEKLQAKIWSQEFEKETMKRLIEIENVVRMTDCQADLANEAVKTLEMANEEIKAEMEAFKLSTSESNKMRLENTKRERKCNKRIMALEKQNNNIQKGINEEKNKSLELQQRLAQLMKAQEDFEVKLRQEEQAEEVAVTQVQDELRLKGEADTNLKRNQVAVRQNMEIDCQRCKDDMQRLEQQISSLQMTLCSADPYHLPNILFLEELDLERPHRDTFGVMLPVLDMFTGLSEEETSDRVCLMCMRNEASFLFLPCAHQVLCASCTEDHYNNNMEARCPCCQAPIAQRIRVYGAST